MEKRITVAGAVKGVSVENNILLAIRRHCLDCMGGNKEDVDSCKASPESRKSRCALWDYRSGPLTTAETNKKRLLYVINAHCKQCLVGGDVKNCTTDGSNGFNKCVLFELRV